MGQRGAWLATSLVSIVLLVAGCGFGQPPQVFVDGLPIGGAVPCADADCERFTDFAVATLDQAVPDHAPIVGVEAYTPDFRTLDGQATILTTRSGGHDLIIVVRLEDDTARAFYIGCGVGLDQERCFLGPPDLSD